MSITNGMEFNRQAEDIAKLALASPKPYDVVQRYQTNPASRLAAFIAKGIVDKAQTAKQNQQAMAQYNPQQPTVLDAQAQKMQQGMASIPTTHDMFSPDDYGQGIAGGLPEDTQQMAGGGVVAFSGGGGPSGSPFLLSEEYLRAIAAENAKVSPPPVTPETDTTLQKALERGKGRAAAAAAQAEAASVGKPPVAPPRPPITPQTDVALQRAIDQGKARAAAARAPSSALGIDAGRPPPQVAGSGIASPGANLPPNVQAVTANPTPPPAAATGAQQAAASATPKPGWWERVKGSMSGPERTGRMSIDPALRAGTGRSALGVGRAILNRAGVLGLAGTIGYEVGDRLKNTSGARWLQDLITPESPEERAVNLSLGRAPTPSGQPTAPGKPPRKQAEIVDTVLWPALLHTESGGRQFKPDGTPVTSPKGAIGIAQVMPTTGPEAAELAGLPWDETKFRGDAAYNEALGKAYFSKQLDTFGGDVAKALSAYNAGPGRTAAAIKRGEKEGKDWRTYLPKETQDYIAKIQSRVEKTVGGAAAVAPEKPGVVRAVEMTTEAPTTVPNKLTDNGAEYLLRGLTPTGIREGFKAIPTTVMGAVDAIRGTSTPEQPAPKPPVVDKPVTPGGMAPGEAAAKAAEMTSDRQQQRNIALALMLSGAKALSGKSPYALQNLGEGFGEGLKGFIGMEQADAAAATKAAEKALDRGQKGFDNLVKIQLGLIKQQMPQLAGDPQAELAMAHSAVIASMNPLQLRAQGLTVKDQLAAKAMLAQGMAKAATPAKSGTGFKPTEAQAAALQKYSQ